MLIDCFQGRGGQDPELSTAVIDLLSKLVPRHLGSLLLLPRDKNDILQMAVTALRGPESLLKQAAAHFWVSLPFSSQIMEFATKVLTQALFVQDHELRPDLQSHYDAALDTYSPLLCRELAFQLGGLAQRSQLDSLAEPIKKLVFHRAPLTKRWIETSLNDPDFPSQKVDDAGKRVWLLKLMK